MQQIRFTVGPVAGDLPRSEKVQCQMLSGTGPAGEETVDACEQAGSGTGGGRHRGRRKTEVGAPQEEGQAVSAASVTVSGAVLDAQFLLHPIVHDMKTTFWYTSSYSHQREKECHSVQAHREDYPMPQFQSASVQGRRATMRSAAPP